MAVLSHAATIGDSWRLWRLTHKNGKPFGLVRSNPEANSIRVEIQPLVTALDATVVALLVIASELPVRQRHNVEIQTDRISVALQAAAAASSSARPQHI
ncbi:MAG: hypothetical protein ABI577_00260 [bacterium]